MTRDGGIALLVEHGNKMVLTLKGGAEAPVSGVPALVGCYWQGASVGSISNAQRAFSQIYERDVWGKGSGVGSEPQHTIDYVKALQSFLSTHTIESVVDFGCGDWQFSQLIDWRGARYDGFDVVGSVIEANRARFGSDQIRFHQVQDGTMLPRADLLICKDVMQHLPNADVQRYLRTFKQLYAHLLITNDIAPAEGTNDDINTGQWRPLRLDQPPFHEHFNVALTWDVNAYGCQWTKQTCHLQTSAKTRPATITLRDEQRALATEATNAWRSAKVAIFAMPLLGPAVLAVRKLLSSR